MSKCDNCKKNEVDKKVRDVCQECIDGVLKNG